MIIGLVAENNELIVSYYDQNGKIAYLKKRLYDHELFNWEESNKPSIYRNWDGKYIKSKPSDAKWLTRSRLEELLIEKLTKEERDLIYDFNNYPKKSYLDIEIQLNESGEFPYPDKVKMPVCLISFCNEEGVSYVLSIMKSDEYPNGLDSADIEKMQAEINEHFKKIVPHDKNDKKLFEIDFKVKHKFFNTEEELLSFFFHQILPKMSFITGWNVIDFDWQYLMNRCSKLKIDPFKNLTSNRTFSKRYKQPVHIGILDYMQFFQDPAYKPYKVVENYTLDYISKRALNITKLKHPYKNMMEFQKDIYMFTKYNIIDNILVKLVDDKFDLLTVAYSLANIAEIEVNKIHSPIHITEVLMCRELLNNGKRMMKLPYDSEGKEDKKYDGAYVMPPVPGHYKYISCYDFKSMYPNLQMQFNCSADAYLGKIEDIPDWNKHIWTKNGTVFSGSFDSVTRIILERLYNARIDAQEKIKELKFKK
jgi:DNA polymerase elongation subunit (family B)